MTGAFMQRVGKYLVFKGHFVLARKLCLPSYLLNGLSPSQMNSPGDWSMVNEQPITNIASSLHACSFVLIFVIG